MATEVRLALAMNGGVSLAVWIGGLTDELLRLLHAGQGHADAQPEYLALCRDLDVRPVVDVVAGSSAGGLNGAVLGLALVNGCRDLDGLRDLWIDQGAFSELLQDPSAPDLPSLLRGESWFLLRIREALEAVAASGSGVGDVDPPLDVRLTATALDGQVLTIADGPSTINTADHRVEFRFTNADFDLGADPNASMRLARALRSTSSFPGAFEPSPVTEGLYEARHIPSVFGALAAGPAYLVDGGVLNNLPAANAVDAIIRQPSRERVERILALIVPDPGGPPVRVDGAPGFADALSRSAVGIPRNQSLADFVTDVQAHNQEVRSRRGARAAWFGQFSASDPAAAWSTFVAVSDALFASYRAARHRTSLDRVASRQSGRLDVAAAGLTEESIRADLSLLPWVPRELSAGTREWAWGGTPIRRLAALLITWVNIAATGARAKGDVDRERELYVHKRAVASLREQTDQIAPVGAIDELLLDELRNPAMTTATALRAAASRWAAAGDGRADALGRMLVELADELHAVVELARPVISLVEDGEDSAMLAGVVALHDGAGGEGLVRLLLGVEVIEVAFAGTEPRPDQTIRLAQFSATQSVAIDPRRRDRPEEKLAGVELGHFAAFLKRSWRANDWMWGRLDGAERVVRLLDQVTGGTLEREGRLDDHLRAVQAAVLRDMLPLVAAKIVEDGKAGSHVSAEAQVFLDAVAAGVSEGAAGPLAGAGESELAELLAANRVGEERLDHEAGSRQASATARTALATTFALLQRQAPRGVRAPIGVMSRASMLAWRVGRMASRQRLALAAGLIVVVVVAVAVVGYDLAGNDVGVWIVPASVIVVVAVVVVIVRALPVLGWLSRRTSKPKPGPDELALAASEEDPA